MRKTNAVVVLLCFVVTVLALCPTEAFGQLVFGTISGSVTDPSGAVIPNAVVKISDVNTGVVHTFKTNESGIYNATSLTPGVYKVEASASGFKTAVVSAITLEVNTLQRVDLPLRVGDASEAVDVMAEAPLLTTQQSDLGQTVAERQIDQLPTHRSLFNLLPLSAGVSQQAGCDGCGNFGNMRINGDRPRAQDFVLDGTTITPRCSAARR